MKVILQKDVEKLGIMGDLVNVAEGFARNYLIPQGLALKANKNNVKSLEHQKKVIQNKLNVEMKESQKLAEKLSAHSCTISKKVGENDKIFGSVTAADIEAALLKDGYKISKKDIVLAESIKVLGVYTIPVKISSGIEANLKVWVVQE